jgi:hypothetical protein
MNNLSTIYSYTNMAGVDSYIPSSHPMTSRRGVSGPQSTQMVLTYRPPPPNHKVVVRNKNIDSTPTCKPPYIKDSTGAGMWHHLCSPAGVRGRATIGNEFSDDQADDVGVFRPPYNYTRQDGYSTRSVTVGCWLPQLFLPASELNTAVATSQLMWFRTLTILLRNRQSATQLLQHQTR